MPSISSFLFHDVTDNPEHTGFQKRSAQKYKHSNEEFEAHLEAIIGSNNEILKITDFDLSDFSETGIVLTFDDGGKSFVNIANILERYNVYGHFMITTDMIGDENFLGKEEIKELNNRGHIIGAHSHTHPDIFMSLSWEEMVHEMSKSKKIIEDIIGEPCTVVSIPGGDVSRKVFNAASNCGFRYVFTSDPFVRPKLWADTSGGDERTWIIGRILPMPGESVSTVSALASLETWVWRKRYWYRFVKQWTKFILLDLYKIYTRYE